MILNRTLLIILSSLVISGCAKNHISGGLYDGNWAGKSTLISGNGDLIKGSTIFNVAYKDGTISFPASPWGSLEGKFSFQDQNVSVTSAGIGAVFTGNQTIAIPKLNNMNIRKGSSIGKAYLATDGKVILLCNITGQFITTGNLDYELVGSGVCSDATGKSHNLMFERSTSH